LVSIGLLSAIRQPLFAKNKNDSESSCRCWSLVSACHYDDQQQKEGKELKEKELLFF